MKFFLFSIFLLTTLSLRAQTITNGTFDAISTGWGCSPEASFRETTYGGSDGSNRVAEVDIAAGLCQTISGFTIGNNYTLTFSCSRRTTCGPVLQTMDVTISGGALSTTVSRNGTSFNLETESFNFVATSTSHTLTLAGTSAGTCGLIVDNFEISTSLPIQLISFEGKARNDQFVELLWSTESETNNDYFQVEHSSNGIDWEVISILSGAGNSTEVLNYQCINNTPFMGSNYYRLKQVDFDGTFEYSEVIVVEFEPLLDYAKVTIYPIPARQQLTVTAPKSERDVIRVYSSEGKDVTNNVSIRSGNTSSFLDLSNLAVGFYILKTPKTTSTFTKQ